MTGHALIYLASRAAPGLLQLAGLAIFTRLVSPEEYGRYVLVLSTASFVLATVFRGLLQCQVRYVPVAVEPGEREAFDRTLVGAVVVLLTLLAVGWLLTAAVVAPELRSPFRFGAALFVGLVLVEFQLERHRARSRPGRYAILAVARAAIVVSAITTVLGMRGTDATSMIRGHSLALFAVFAVELASTWREYSIGALSAIWLDRIRRYFGPLIPVAALQLMLSIGDRYLLAWRGSDALVGEYSAAYTLAEYTLVLLLSAIHLASYPAVSRAWSASGRTAATVLMQQTLILLLAVGIPTCLSLMALATHASELLFGEAFRANSRIVILWVAPAMLYAGLRSFYLDLTFHLMERTSALVLPLIAAVIVNVALNYAMIPSLGVEAAAISTHVAYATALLIGASRSRRAWSIPLPRRGLVRLAVAVAVFAPIQLWAMNRSLGPAIVMTIVAWTAYAAVLLAPDLRARRRPGSTLLNEDLVR